MTATVRKHVRIDPALLSELEDLILRKPGASLSREVNLALKEYVSRHKAGREELILAPVMERLLNTKMDQQETWLRSGVWAGATYSATATLLLLELLCGQQVDPKDAREHLELIRGRAWKLVRRANDPKEEP